MSCSEYCSCLDVCLHAGLNWWFLGAVYVDGA